MRFGRFQRSVWIVGLAVLAVACGAADSEPGEEAVPGQGGEREASEARSTNPGIPYGVDAEKLSGAGFQFTVAIVPAGVVDTIFVHNGKAFSQATDSPQFDVVFDLVDQEWIDVASRERMSYAESAQRWETARTELLGRMQQLPGEAEIQAVEFLLQPEFTVEQEGDRVEFFNELGSVTVDAIRPEDESWASAFHVYNRLSSSWLFVTQRGLPDTMIDETMPHLEKLGLLPGTIDCRPSPATGVVEHTIVLEYQPLDAEIGAALDGFYETLVDQ